MDPWQRLVSSGAEPRRAASPGIAFLAVVLAAGQSATAVFAFTDGRTLQGVAGLGLAACFAGWTVATLCKRRSSQRG